MTALIIIGVILFIIALILLIRVGVMAEYSEEGFVLEARVGPMKKQLMPSQKKDGEQKPKKPKKKPEDRWKNERNRRKSRK